MRLQRLPIYLERFSAYLQSRPALPEGASGMLVWKMKALDALLGKLFPVNTPSATQLEALFAAFGVEKGGGVEMLGRHALINVLRLARGVAAAPLEAWIALFGDDALARRGEFSKAFEAFRALAATMRESNAQTSADGRYSIQIPLVGVDSGPIRVTMQRQEVDDERRRGAKRRRYRADVAVDLTNLGPVRVALLWDAILHVTVFARADTVEYLEEQRESWSEALSALGKSVTLRIRVDHPGAEVDEEGGWSPGPEAVRSRAVDLKI
ncbi:MAG: hypothetical protein H6684_09765 [Deltaproteobacteria bacterium]|nr:hypothetical protein [Deltaproteobacteria bacterium]MCB9489004.1 hypothetical protein [Deltaproteobacteria bacterium]